MTSETQRWLSEAREDPSETPMERRPALLQALRDAPGAEDRALVRALFDAELAQVEADPAAAVDDLALAGYLLTQVGEPDDIWRMARAKFANDTTASAFAGEHLLFQGIEATAAFLATAEHPLASRVRYYLFDGAHCYIRPDRLARWRRNASLTYGKLFADAA